MYGNPNLMEVSRLFPVSLFLSVIRLAKKSIYVPKHIHTHFVVG